MLIIKNRIQDLTSKNSIFLYWNLLQKYYFFNLNKLAHLLNNKSLIYVRSKFIFFLLERNYKFFFPKSLINFYFNTYRFILFSGLGYKKKIFKSSNLIFTYIANRHWIVFKLKKHQLIFPIKRRNFIIISSTKLGFNNLYNFFSSLQKPYIYKMKGFIDTRVKQRFLFVRRIRIKGIKTKLSKKQMML